MKLCYVVNKFTHKNLQNLSVNEREVFEPQEYWSIEANFLKDKDTIPAQIYSVNGERIKKFDITNQDSASDLSEKVKEEQFSISEINKKPVIYIINA